MKKKEIIEGMEIYQEKMQLVSYLLENPVLQENLGGTSEALQDITANMEQMISDFENFREIAQQ